MGHVVVQCVVHVCRCAYFRPLSPCMYAVVLLPAAVAGVILSDGVDEPCMPGPASVICADGKRADKTPVFVRHVCSVMYCEVMTVSAVGSRSPR